MIKKRNKTRTNSQRYAKRLASYTAAAGLGAFSVGQGASAGVVFTDIPDVVLTESTMTYAIDVDGDGTPEVHIDLLFNQYPIAAGGDVWARPEGLPTPATSILVPYLVTAWNGVDYYINAFAPGATIGPLSDVAENNTYDNGGLLGYDINNFPTYNYAYSIFGAGGFLGLKWDIGGGDERFGWVEMDQEVVEGYNTQQQVTIRSFAFESTPNTAIVAEIPPGFEADFDGDGDVDGDDFLAWQTGFGTPSGAMKSQGDYDNDGDVDGDDFLGWQDEFGSPAAGNGSGAVPEPSSLALLAAGAGALAFRRRTNSV